MLRKSFAFLLSIGVLIEMCHGQRSVTTGDSNTKWRSADLLEKLGYDFYHSLALGPLDAFDSEKRFVSVFGNALFEYLISQKDNDDERIRESVNNTRLKLYQPADAMAGPIRAVISMLYNVIEPPLTDIRQACPYTACEADCQKALAKIQADKIRTCPGYRYNIDIYDTAISYVTSCGLLQELGDLTIKCNGSDDDALDFFLNTALNKFREALKLFRKIFDQMNDVPPSMQCNTFTFL